MSDRWLTFSLAAATAIPYGLLGDFGPGNSVLPWLGMFAGCAAWVVMVRWGLQRGWWRIAHQDGEPISPYLRVLGLTDTSSGADVKRAFRKQARRHHPDAGGDAARFCELVEAKEHVLDGLESA